MIGQGKPYLTFRSKTSSWRRPILVRGVNITNLNLVVMANPVKSHVMIRQLIGKVSRIAAGKTYAYVLIPMILTDGCFDDNYNDDNESVMNDSYKNRGLMPWLAKIQIYIKMFCL